MPMEEDNVASNVEGWKIKMKKKVVQRLFGIKQSVSKRYLGGLKECQFFFFFYLLSFFSFLSFAGPWDWIRSMGSDGCEGDKEICLIVDGHNQMKMGIIKASKGI